MRIAFKMKLIKGYEDEYKKRHDEIWDELKQLLKQKEICDYSIFIDETYLFGSVNGAHTFGIKLISVHEIPLSVLLYIL